MIPDDAQLEFEQTVDDWTRAAIAGRSTLDFAALVGDLPGVYPSEVWSSIERLALAGEVPFDVVQSLGQSKVTAPPAASAEPVCPLPVPHPLDFDWRFSSGTVDVLLKRCLDLTRRDDTLTFLGTPRLAIRAARSSFARRVTCLDRNPAVVATVIQYGHPQAAQLFDAATDAVPFPAESAAICLDPPWYLPEFRSFLWTASALSRTGGHVLLSVPALGTRPRMGTDWVEMQAWADRCGLSLQRYERSAIVYLSPPFEQNALRAGGFTGVSTHWRRSDLATFVRSDRPLTARPAKLAGRPQWTETVISRVAFRIRDRGQPGTTIEFRDPRLRTLLPGDVLPSVSVRDGRRYDADVWTTGNRIFGCQGTSVLESILNALADQIPVVTRVARAVGRCLGGDETDLVFQAVQQIEKLVTMEVHEQANGLHDVSVGLATPSLS